MTLDRLLVLVGSCLLVASCAGTPDSRPATSPGSPLASPPPVVDALLRGERITESFDSLASRVALAPDSDFGVALIGADAQHSHHVVSIRNAEVPHRHDEHDLLVVILKGHGEMLLGDEVRTVGAGSIVYIPRRTRHAFSNQPNEPPVAYAIYTPPFDGKDRVADE